jgi:hypothetical protein
LRLFTVEQIKLVTRRLLNTLHSSWIRQVAHGIDYAAFGKSGVPRRITPSCYGIADDWRKSAVAWYGANNSTATSILVNHHEAP